MDNNHLLSIKEVAEYLGVHYNTIYRKVAIEYVIPSVRIGSLYRIKREDVDDYLKVSQTGIKKVE